MTAPSLPPRPSILLTACTYSEWGLAGSAIGELAARFGPHEGFGEPYDFNFTRYYEREMGAGLTKRLVLFGAVHPGFLPRAKRFCGRVEAKMADPATGKRRVNLDPGYLTAAALVLASTKGAPHRIYLGLGIYGELTLVYHDGGYHPLPWTYPDFRQESVLHFLAEARRGLMARRGGGEGRARG